MKVIFHLGMGKCGSSALQNFLSSKQFIDIAKGKCTYAAIHKDGNVLHGHKLIKSAKESPFGHVSSHNFQVIKQASNDDKRRIKQSLKKLGKQYDTIILSNEGWGPSPDKFNSENIFLLDRDVDVEVVIYIRPQVEWFNSAWWQWGAWSGLDLDTWVDKNLKKSLWCDTIDKWADKTWVKKVHVRLMPSNIVEDFMGLMDLPTPNITRSNQSLPEYLLRFFQKNRSLRPGPHSSAIEFILARHLSLPPQKTPWILDTKMVDMLINYHLENNNKLKKYFTNDSDQLNRFISDDRWWSAAAYLNKEISPITDNNIPPQDLEQMLLSAIESIVKLDHQVRRLQAKVSGGSN